ncbi:ATP-dependent nuclease [Psychromonas antarctica]|uniref:ATP-dependent nuclease n=1 Tax=Psychromonas antarctica TaxID=67573 RepID=UPI001EE81F3E|nr:AAA family ATPase [Psychromonas antarctica]MCG6200036.1 AAA family ATPase [Psychromonas antarctica]
MNILIDQARIAGFRGIANVEISLPRVTVLIGTNNSGKTSIIKALQLALGDYSRYLTEEDFHIDNDDHVVECIVIDVRIVAMDEHDKRAKIFEAEWLEELGDIIQAEADGSQFVVIRTKCERDKVRGGFLTARFWLEAWPEFDGWIDVKTIAKRQIRKRFDALPFISIDAQRDIHQELREKTSYIGKVLASVEYDDEDVKELEKMVADINEKAIVKSEPLSELKTHLDALSQSFEGSGQTDITPFPKKIRDLSKRFTVHFGENEGNSFSMEYHGMGTRSWASMLTVKAFTELSAKKHAEEVKPFFPIIAAEEPEAHLHPNAQRTLYQQLRDSKGQVIVSTHSPFLAAMGNLQDLRSMVKTASNVSVKQLPNVFDAEDLLILQREVMRFRGEVLFARGIILFEGVTEEQIVPAMFEHYFGFTAFAAGVNCISVAGKNYAPFIKLACSLGIPVCVVGDNDGNAKITVESQIENIRRDTRLALNTDEFQIFFLSDNNDIEAELVNELGITQELAEALVLSETKGSGNPHYVAAKQQEISELNNDALLEKLRSAKASYAGFLAAVIYRNPQARATGALVPTAFRNAFEQVRGWISS